MLEPSEKWDLHFLHKALFVASMSKDPRRKVGAILVDDDRGDVSSGFNGFPRGIKDTPERLNDRDLKLKIVVHAEMNAVLWAARRGFSVKGTTLFLAAEDSTGYRWGGPPCTRCAVELIQAGIANIVSLLEKPDNKWAEDLAFSRTLLWEAGITYREVELK